MPQAAFGCSSTTKVTSIRNVCEWPSLGSPGNRAFRIRLIAFSVQVRGGTVAHFERDPAHHKALIDFFVRTGKDYQRVGITLAVAGLTGTLNSQFSSSVIELSDPAHVGTILNTQTCAGFLLTLVTIHLVPLLVNVVGWPWAFAALAPGPFLGVVAMGMLWRRPEAARLADGRGGTERERNMAIGQ